VLYGKFIVNGGGRGISACAVRFAVTAHLISQQPNQRWKVMNKIVLACGILALSFVLSASAMAGGAGYLKKDQPQAQDGQGDGPYPGGHGGGGFGTSDVTHTSPNGHADPSGTNGNQGSDNNNPHADNADRGNAGGPGGGECDGDCGGGGE
jgi:hypothetical protein